MDDRVAMYNEKVYQRLIAKTRKDEATGCWIWTGFIAMTPHPGNRYGSTSIPLGFGRGRTMATHRAMMWAIHGPLTPEQCVCHKCDVPACINPDHLFIGSMKDNIWDSRRKGRHYEARRMICERGHPLTGKNVYLSPSKNGTKRTCLICQKARYRLKLGWPEHLAYDPNLKIPPAHMLDRRTWQIVPIKTYLHSLSAGERTDG